LGTIDPVYHDVGKLIRVRRRAIGVTQESLGQSIGLTRTSINNIEHGRQAIQVHMLRAIASALSVEVTALLPGSGPIDAEVEKQLPKKMPAEDKAWLRRVLIVRE
jgi:transcriptional regulator with XRE-family HTH domain